jgi:hypothetical protein
MAETHVANKMTIIIIISQYHKVVFLPVYRSISQQGGRTAGGSTVSLVCSIIIYLQEATYDHLYRKKIKFKKSSRRQQRETANRLKYD